MDCFWSPQACLSSQSKNCIFLTFFFKPKSPLACGWWEMSGGEGRRSHGLNCSGLIDEWRFDFQWEEVSRQKLFVNQTAINDSGHEATESIATTKRVFSHILLSLSATSTNFCSFPVYLLATICFFVVAGPCLNFLIRSILKISRFPKNKPKNLAPFLACCKTLPSSQKFINS